MTVNENLWDFPHPMRLKVMGAVDAPLTTILTEVLSRHLGDFDADRQLTQSLSSNGKFISLSANIVMHNKEQVAAIYADLNASSHVKIVL